jgi:hypothetical protein
VLKFSRSGSTILLPIASVPSYSLTSSVQRWGLFFRERERLALCEVKRLAFCTGRFRRWQWVERLVQTLKWGLLYCFITHLFVCIITKCSLIFFVNVEISQGLPMVPTVPSRSSPRSKASGHYLSLWLYLHPASLPSCSLYPFHLGLLSALAPAQLIPHSSSP